MVAWDMLEVLNYRYQRTWSISSTVLIIMCSSYSINFTFFSELAGKFLLLKTFYHHYVIVECLATVSGEGRSSYL